MITAITNIIQMNLNYERNNNEFYNLYQAGLKNLFYCVIIF